MAITKIHAIKSTLGKAIAYIENPEKTDGQLLVSGYNTEPQMAALDFEMTATLARKVRKSSGKQSSNLAYHLIQSFAVDDNVSPEQAHALGKKLAAEFTEGRFEYVVATHIDKGHIHNHIMINAVSFYDYKKFRTVPYRTAAQIRSISDRLCAEAELSVIDAPQKLGQKYTAYTKRKTKGAIRPEVRRRLNWVLAHADSYDHFVSMAQELGITVDGTGKNVTYLLDGAKRVVRGDTLADDEQFEANGIRDRTASNRINQARLKAMIHTAASGAQGYDDFLKALQAAGVTAKFNRRTGVLVYTLPEEGAEDARAVVTIPETALGSAYTTEAIREAIASKNFSFVAAQPGPTIQELYDSQRKAAPNTPDTLVELSSAQILDISGKGLLLRVFDHNGDTATVLIDANHINTYPDGRVQIAIGSQFLYDLTSPEHARSTLRGEEIIRQLELENGVSPTLMELPASAIKSMSLKGVTITLPEQGIDRLFVPAEYVHYDRAASRCAVNIYDNWNYSYVPLKAESAETAEKQERQNITGQMLAGQLAAALQPAQPDTSLKSRIAYVERKAKIANVKHLASTLLQMQDDHLHTAADFVPKLQELNSQIHGLQKQIAEISAKNKQYGIAARCLQTCQSKASVWKQYGRQPALLKKAFYSVHKDDLDAYQQATEVLEQMGVRQEVDPQKVAGLVIDRENQIRDIEKRIDLLTEQKNQFLTMKNTVDRIQSTTRKEENEHENPV